MRLVELTILVCNIPQLKAIYHAKCVLFINTNAVGYKSFLLRQSQDLSFFLTQFFLSYSTRLLCVFLIMFP